MTKHKLPKNNHPQIPQHSVPTTQAQFYSSPYPLPAVIEGYERICSGMGKEVVETAVQTVKQQGELQRLALDRSTAYEFRKLHLAAGITILALLGGFALAIFNKDAKSYAFLVFELGGFIAAFLYSRKK